MSSKRQRVQQQLEKVSRTEAFLAEFQDEIGDIWEFVLDKIDISSLPIFAKDEPEDGSAFKRFAWMLADKFFNKVRVVDDDESIPSESGSDDSCTCSITEETDSGTDPELESDDDSHFQGVSDDEMSDSYDTEDEFEEE